jgi:hypothetical protein
LRPRKRRGLILVAESMTAKTASHAPRRLKGEAIYQKLRGREELGPVAPARLLLILCVIAVGPQLDLDLLQLLARQALRR